MTMGDADHERNWDEFMRSEYTRARAVRRTVSLAMVAAGATGLATALVVAYFLGLSQNLDEMDGPMHECPPCAHEEAAEHVEPAPSITPPYRHGGGSEAVGMVGRVR